MNYLIASLTLVSLLSYDSVLFTIHMSSEYEFIKGGAYLCLLAICLSFNQIQHEINRYVVVLYLILVVYLLIPTFINGGDAFLLWIKTAVRFSYLLIFLTLFRVRGRSLTDTILTLYFWLGLLLAIQTIILFLLVVSDHPPRSVLIPRFNENDFFVSHGIFGFANSVSIRGGYIGFRTQSFFSEATTFALFQILPLYFSISNIRINWGYKFSTVLILASIITTFSFSAIVGLAIGMVCYFFGGASRKLHNFKMLALFIICLMIIFYSYKYVTNQDNFDQNSFQGAVISRPQYSTTVRTEWSTEVFNAVAEEPFGVAYEEFGQRHGLLPQAPVRWFLIGGYIGGLLMIFIQILLVLRYFMRGLNSKLNLERETAACCVTLMVASIVHGTWSDIFYFLPIALLISFQKSNSFRQANNTHTSIVPC
jgi:hypothetical protein